MKKRARNLFIILAACFVFIASLASCDKKVTVVVEDDTTKKTPTIVAPTAKENLFYTGEDITLINLGTSNDGYFKYKVGEEKYSTDAPKAKDAGSYNVYYKFYANEGFKDLGEEKLVVTINKSAPQIEAPTAIEDLVYTGNNLYLINEGRTNFGRFSYSLDGKNFTYDLPTAKNAGTYRVWYMVEEEKNNNASEKKFLDVTIAKATPTITAPTPKRGLEYKGFSQILINTGYATFADMLYSMDGVNYSTNTPMATNAGTYKVWYKIVENDNVYGIEPQSFDVTIAKATITNYTPPKAIENIVYNGENQVLIEKGLAPGGHFIYRLENGTYPIDEALPSAKYPGLYKVYYKSEETENYYAIEEQYIEVRISSNGTKIDPIVTAPTAKTLTYNGEEQTLIDAATTTGGTLKYSINNINYSESLPKGINAGTYTVYYKVDGDDVYNDVEVNSISVTIAKVNPTVKAPTAKTLTYNGNLQALINEGETNYGDILYKINDGSYSTDIPEAKEEGTYTVYYKVDGTDNWNDYSEQSITVEIKEAPSGPTITSTVGSNETIVLTFNVPQGASNTDYNIYYSTVQNSFTSDPIDSELIMIDGTVATAYIVGLKSDNYYVKVENASDPTKYSVTSLIQVSAQDRSGYAHYNYTDGVGAYNDDGTLKTEAKVLYVTEKNKNTITYDGTTGIAAILKKKHSNPLDVRIIGTVGAAMWASPTYSTGKYDVATTSTIRGNNGQYLQLQNYNEEDLIDKYNVLDESTYTKLNGLTNKIKYDSSKNEFDSYYNMLDIDKVSNVTVEGVGTDAALAQWGITWKRCTSIEIKNLTFVDYPEDACAFEGEYSDLSTSTKSLDVNTITYGYYWIHNNTFNIGKNNWDVCHEHDKGDGDGATDIKKVRNATYSYNKYVGTHKTGLVGGSEKHVSANITFHHNWYVGCKSRMPYARQANMHMYNNYYDSSTGITMQIYAGAYAFVENCYFKNDNKTYDFNNKGYTTPAVKSYNNIYDGSNSYSVSGVSIVSDRTETVTNGNIFNQNFDTDENYFYYDSVDEKTDVSIMNEVEDVPAYLQVHAGAGANCYQSLELVEEVEKHTVTYHYLDENGDVIKASTTAKIDDGVTLLKPANPTVSGYDFDNWYTSDSFDTVYTFGNAITADVDIYAKFTEEVVSPDTIATDTVYSFSKAVQKTSNDIIIDQDTLQNDDPVTVSKLTIDTTSGKFAYNGNGWYQMNTGTILSFKTSKAVEIKVTLYDSKSLTFTGQGLDVTQSNSEHTVVTTAGGEVEILVNDNNTYIGLLEIYVRDLSKVADSLELKTVTIGAGTSTSYTNGTYVATNLKTIYSLNEEFDPAGLYGIVTYTDFSTDVVTSATGLSFDGFSSTTAGEKTIIVSYTSNETVTATLKIYVVDTAPAIENETLKIKVLPSYTGIIGAVNDGYNIFKTINQALDYLRIYENTYSSYNKYIYLAAGTYNEKVEIDIPNLTIEGINKNTTIIEYNSLFGQSESNGFTHVTDSTQTLAVREAATNFTLKNVTVSNYWNSYDRFVAEFGNNNCEHRALAMLIQADKVIVDSCKLLGYQDTLEAFTGRSLFANSYISGATDFIFGTNPTMYFKNCEIHSIYTGTTDGGYINAFKGMNKGDTDYVTYGAIYDGCNFTADSTVTAPNTSIARPWDKYSSVMVMNSTIGTHISTTAYTSGTAKNQRYVCWTKNGSTASEPTTATVKFLEYNNSGSSAISASISGVTVLTETEAANYNNLAVIFGTTNGAVEYTSTWNVTVPEAQQTTTETYEFNFEDGNMVDENGFFTISGTGYDLKSVSSSKTYDGTTYTKALKIDSKPTITFTTTEEMTLTIVAYTSTSIDIDGTKVAVDSDFNIIKMAIGVGTHTIKKGSGENSIYAIIVE